MESVAHTHGKGLLRLAWTLTCNRHLNSAGRCTKTGSSLSCSSRESQAFGRSIVCTHWVSKVVLPKPAGAHTRVISPSSATFRRSMRRVLVMTSLALCGRKSFVRIKERREPVVVTGSGTGSMEATGLSVDSVVHPLFECLPASLRAAFCRFERLIECEDPRGILKTLPMRLRNTFHSNSP